MVLFSTSDLNNQCFITTVNIDGETDIKTKSTLFSTSTLPIQTLLSTQPLIICEEENPNTSSFEGILKLNRDTQVERISIASMLLRGCRIVFTGWIFSY